MKVIPHTDEMIGRAFEKASRREVLSGSITGGSASAAGYLGEEAVSAYLGAGIVSDSEFGHDLILLDGRTCEVKTKRRTVPPIGTYEVSVASASRHQQPDLYAFVSLQFQSSGSIDDLMRYHGLVAVWLLGYKEPREYFLQSERWEQGDTDPDNGFVSHVEMYNLPIHMLRLSHAV